jgi:hypothetical protein
MLNKKHILAVAAAGAVAFGATSLSAAPVLTNTAAIKAADADTMTQVRYKRHRTHHRVLRQSQNWGVFGAPFAAAAGAAAVTGAVVGGTTAALTGYPYAYGPYAYGPYAYDAYGSYAYAPNGLGWSPDIGHRYYNGAAAPASQDNCAVDGGYGRLDYAVAC